MNEIPDISSFDSQQEKEQEFQNLCEMKGFNF